MARIDGTPSYDSLVGTIGNDLIFGYGGNDIIAGTSTNGDDTIFGGAGSDDIYFNGFISGSAVIYGDAGSDEIYFSGNSTAYGGDGDDYIYSNYLLSDRNSRAFIDGGPGFDSMLISHNNSTIFGGSGGDRINNYGNRNIIFGNQYSETIYGYGEQSTIFGGQGNDAFQQLGRQDIAFGNIGDDTMFCGPEGTVFGGQGNDRLWGNTTSSCTLSGDLGDDEYRVGLGAARMMFGANSGNDVVFLFDATTGDRLDIQGQSFSIIGERLGPNENAVYSETLVRGTLIGLSGGGTILLSGISSASVNASFFA